LIWFYSCAANYAFIIEMLWSSEFCTSCCLCNKLCEGAQGIYFIMS